MRISDWSSDVCSSDLATADHGAVVSGVERVEAEVGGDAAAVEQGGQAPAPVVAVDGEVFARDGGVVQQLLRDLLAEELVPRQFVDDVVAVGEVAGVAHAVAEHDALEAFVGVRVLDDRQPRRSEEHTSELQSLMRSSYAVFCLKKKKN